MGMLDKASYWKIIQENAHLKAGHQALATQLYAKDAAIHICSPIGDVTGGDGLYQGLWSPLLDAMPDLERRTDILLSGQFTNKVGETGTWMTSSGFFVGHFEAPLWGIEPTRRPIWLRYGWFDRIEGDRVVESYIILDMTRFLMDAGQWPLAPALGQGQWPAPQTQDGIVLDPADPAASDKSLKLVEAMIGGLMQYDRQSLASMGMTRFWHPQFNWYGPGCIGTARGHKDYERTHQGPFLAAFPDRVGGNHKCRIGDGDYVASTGWPSINATHMGDSWLGLPTTNKRVTMKVMDFWRRDGDLLAENWVFIDILDVLNQIGVDVMARVRALKGENVR
jgi:predicted ester cyclase